MKYSIKSFNGCKADFYIQCKGLNSGKPLTKPIPNCVAVNCDNPIFKEVVQALFIGRFFEPHIKGSVIPFVTIDSMHEVLQEGIKNHRPEHLPKLKSIASIDELIFIRHEQIKICSQYKIALCRSLFNI